MSWRLYVLYTLHVHLDPHEVMSLTRLFTECRGFDPLMHAKQARFRLRQHTLSHTFRINLCTIQCWYYWQCWLPEINNKSLDLYQIRYVIVRDQSFQWSKYVGCTISLFDNVHVDPIKWVCLFTLFHLSLFVSKILSMKFDFNRNSY